MRLVIQRVSSASVTIAGEVTARIGPGLLVLVGIENADDASDGEWLAGKICRLRIFEDEAGLMNRSVVDIGGEILLVSQFTLHASMAKGTRPSFNAAARPEQAKPLYELFIKQLEHTLGRPVFTGEFGAMMDIALVNQGPVTLIQDSRNRV
jgi:D-aminoacyl-tRNA deacylase